MGAGSQIRDLLEGLPIDDTWILVGLAVFALAAISHLYGMWREARHGMGGDKKSPHAYPAEQYFEAWETAGDDAGLHVESTDEELEAPRLVGALRGLNTRLEMQLQRSGRRDPDPEAINPATARCRITARVELPFPWSDATIHQFIRPEAVKSHSRDDVRFGEELPEGVLLEDARISGLSRRAIAKMVDEFDSVKVVGGILTVVDTVQPSRNTSQWAGMFRQFIQTLRRQAHSFADGALVVWVDGPQFDGKQELRLDPSEAPRADGVGQYLREQLLH